MPEPPTVFDLESVGQPEITLVATPDEPDAKTIRVFENTLPAHTTVRVSNLDRTGATVAADVPAGDGADLIIPVTDGEELRFEALLGDQRSQPADAIFVLDDAQSGAFHLAPSERFLCLELDPGYALDIAGAATATLSLKNGCDGPVTLDNPRSRLAVADFTLESELPLDIAAGASAELSVHFTPTTAGFREDVLFVDITLDGATIRYPITLRSE